MLEFLTGGSKMLTNEKVLDTIDLNRTMCPLNLNVEIEGHKPMGVVIPNINLAGGIAHVFVCQTGQTVFDTETFSGKIKLLALDESQPYVKVRILSQ